jgi:hypothetical protein
MDRRRFLLTSLAGALAAPLGVQAQQGRLHGLAFSRTCHEGILLEPSAFLRGSENSATSKAMAS